MNDKIQQLIKSFVLLKVLQKAKDTPINMTAEQAVKEHVNLISVLESKSHQDDIKEAKKQKKELKEYKEKLAESSNRSLEKGARGDWKKEGYTFEHEPWNGAASDELYNPEVHDFYIRVKDKNGRTAGYGSFVHEGARLYPAEVGIQSAHQRKGIATHMYNMAQELSNKHVYPSAVHPDKNPEDMSDQAHRFWERRLNAPKGSIGKTEELEKIDKPIRQGEISQDQQYVADIHPSTKKLVWFHHPRIGQSNDNFLKLNRNKFISKYPSEYHPVLNQMFDHVLKDPKRHIIAAYDDKDNKVPGIRARHLKSLILGHNHVQLEPVSGSAVNLHLIRHGLGANYNQRQSIQFKTNKLAASELYKSEIKRYLENIDFFKSWKDSYLLNKAEQQPSVLYHYSPHAGLKELDPKFMGTSGVRGDFNRRFDPSKIVDYPHTTFAYINDEPEDIVKQGAMSKYTLKLEPHQKLYDLSKDHDKLVSQAVQENQGVWNTENIMRKIKDAGWYGVHVSNQDAHPVIRNTVHLFHKHPIHEEEPVV